MVAAPHFTERSMVESGLDIVEIDRIQAAVDRHGERFLARVFTPGERRESRERAESLAARFAAKEAAFKALGKRVAWREVEVQREAGGKPRLLLHGQAGVLADRMGAVAWSLSLSHSRRYAVAVVVALLEKSRP